MDPITMMILCGIVASLVVKTAGAAVTDVVATARGKTPPSQTRWEARQAVRAARGERPEKDPGMFGRWWRNAAEEQAAKAAQKHRAKMEILEEDEEDNVDAYKAKYRERAERWDELGEKVSSWAGTSWENCKAAAAKVVVVVKEAAEEFKERRDEAAAWEENERRDEHAEDDPVTTSDDAESEPVADDPSAEPEADPETVESGPADPAAAETGDGDGADVLPFRRKEKLAEEPAVETDLDLGVMEKPDPVVDEDAELDPDGVSAADGPPGPAAAELVDGAATDESATPVIPAARKEGPVTMTAPAHSGEITNLPTAISYFGVVRRYCDTLIGAFDQEKAQNAQTINDATAQAGVMETAESTLASRGFLPVVTGHVSRMAEHLSQLTTIEQQIQQLMAQRDDTVAALRAETVAGESTFRGQLGLSEAANSHASVASDTGFYRNG